MKMVSVRFFLILLSCVPLIAGALVSAQCDTNPEVCEFEYEQSNDDTFASFAEGDIDVDAPRLQENAYSFETNFGPFNTTMTQSNEAEDTNELDIGDDNHTLEQTNHFELENTGPAGQEVIVQQNNAVVNDNMGAGDDSVTVIQLNDLDIEAPYAANGHDSISSENTLEATIETKDGDDVIELIQQTTIEESDAGDDHIDVTHNMSVDIEAGAGNDTITVLSGINVFAENDPPRRLHIDNEISGTIDAGDDDDSVTVGSNAADNTPETEQDTLFIDGGDGVDTLTLEYDAGTISRHQANQIAHYMANNSSSGTLTINGVVHVWTNFEELILLIEYAVASGTVRNTLQNLNVRFTDGRLNGQHVAAPVAVYCANGGFAIWEIHPDTGDGTHAFTTTLADLLNSKESHGMVTVAVADSGMIHLTAGDYFFPFDPHVCHGF